MVRSTEKLDTFTVSDSVGAVSCLLTLPPDPLAVFVLAHGAGAGMRHSFMQRIADELAGNRVAVIRYNFPFAEHKKKRPDPPAIAMDTAKAAIEYADNKFSNLALFAGGKSFGGRMTSQFISHNATVKVNGLVFLGFPLHPHGKPGTDRAAHLSRVNIPMLFLQGTNDALAKIELIKQVCSGLPGAVLKIYPGADHSFKSPAQDIMPLLAGSIAAWMAEITKSK
jgi:predicted alpha/beta-hydrolase family hydrolase